MVLGFFKKLFGAGDDRSATAGQPGDVRSVSGEDPEIEAFVTYVTKALVDSPESVAVEKVDDPKAVTFKVSCAKSDVGKIIGRSGKTIAAIRALTNGAAGRVGKKVNVEVLD